MSYAQVSRIICSPKRFFWVLLLFGIPCVTECSWQKIKDMVSLSKDYAFWAEMPDSLDANAAKESLLTLQSDKTDDHTLQWRAIVENNRELTKQANLQIRSTERALGPPDILKASISYYTSVRDDLSF